jgi:hypothetical protein
MKSNKAETKYLIEIKQNGERERKVKKGEREK